jgi:hypothetical protein
VREEIKDVRPMTEWVTWSCRIVIGSVFNGDIAIRFNVCGRVCYADGEILAVVYEFITRCVESSEITVKDVPTVSLGSGTAPRCQFPSSKT